MALNEKYQILFNEKEGNKKLEKIVLKGGSSVSRIPIDAMLIKL